MLRDGLKATKRAKDLLHPCGNRSRSASDWQLSKHFLTCMGLIIQAGDSCLRLRRRLLRRLEFSSIFPGACAPRFMLTPAFAGSSSEYNEERPHESLGHMTPREYLLTL